MSYVCENLDALEPQRTCTVSGGGAQRMCKQGLKRMLCHTMHATCWTHLEDFLQQLKLIKIDLLIHACELVVCGDRSTTQNPFT